MHFFPAIGDDVVETMSLAEVENQRGRYRGRIRWHYTEGTGEDWVGFLESMRWMAEGFAVKTNRQRTVYCAPRGPGDSPKAFIKHIRAARPREFLKALVRCKAREEFEAVRMLTRAGVPVTRAVAWGRCGFEGFVVTEALEGCCAFEDAWSEVVLRGGTEAEVFLNAFAAFLRTLIEAGVHHPDMHRGNLLVVPGKAGAAPTFYLVDAYGVTTGRHLDRKKTRALLAWLDDFLAALGPERSGAFLCRVLGRDDAGGGGDLLVDIRVARAAGVRARWRGRRRRLLRQGSIVQVVRSEAGTWRLIKPFTLATAEAALGMHLARKEGEQPEVLKEDVKRRLTRVGAAARSLIVKEYRDVGPLGVFRRDCRSWLNTYHLGLYGIPVARSLAWLRAADGRGFVLFEDAGKDCLFHRLRAFDCSLPRRPLLRAVAQLLASMHTVGALHKDMKTGNFMVLAREECPRSPLTVIDIDAASFGRNVGTRGRVKNLRQVLETLPPDTCVLERLRFLVTYARAAGLPRDTTKAIVSALAEHLAPA